MRHFLERTFEPRVGHVASADSAEAAEALVHRHRFDLVVLDIALPGKSGLQWLRELREAGVGSEVVLITAFADLDTAIEALRNIVPKECEFIFEARTLPGASEQKPVPGSQRLRRHAATRDAARRTQCRHQARTA